MSTYKIIRFYQDDNVREHGKVIKTGLTLKEARAWCKDPETSSKTCTTIEGRVRYTKHGPWFEGYEEE